MSTSCDKSIKLVCRINIITADGIPINIPVCASTGPVLAHNCMFTGIGANAFIVALWNKISAKKVLFSTPAAGMILNFVLGICMIQFYTKRHKAHRFVWLSWMQRNKILESRLFTFQHKRKKNNIWFTLIYHIKKRRFYYFVSSYLVWSFIILSHICLWLTKGASTNHVTLGRVRCVIALSFTTNFMSGGEGVQKWPKLASCDLWTLPKGMTKRTLILHHAFEASKKNYIDAV